MFGQQIYHLRHYTDHIVELLSPAERGPDINCDDDVSPHFSGKLNRQIVNQSAVDQKIIAPFGW